MKTDLEAASADPNLPGVPVYDDKAAKPGAVVGYIVPGINQFVPLSITRNSDALARLKTCNQALLAAEPLADGCVELLEEMGTQPGFLPHTTSASAAAATAP